jgi:hypothetical protein
MKKEMMIAFNQERKQWELTHHCWINQGMVEATRVKAYKMMSSREIPPNADVERKAVFKEQVQKLAEPGGLHLVIADTAKGVDIFKSTQGTGKIISLPKHI